MALNKEEKLKEKYEEYQLLVQQLQQLQENSSGLESHTFNLATLMENLISIKDVKVNQEALIPLGSGIFLKGSLKDNSAVVMNVGSNICVEKNLDEAQQVISQQLNEVNQFLGQLQEEVVKTTHRIQELQSEFQTMRSEKLENS